MAAWKAKPWILKAIASIEKQRVRPGWEYELRIGVDGCEETSSALLEVGIGHYWSEENVGPYLIRNSLIELEAADAYAPFDSDDIMKAPYLDELLSWIGSRGIAGAGRTQVSNKGRILRRRARFQGGVCVMSAGAWAKVGGYRPWRMAADHDLILRARRLGVPVKAVREPLYFRRKHPGSLTNHPVTGLGSPARDELWKHMNQLTAKGKDLCIRPRTVELERRDP